MDPRLDKHLIASFADTTEALAAQTALEAEGIPCEVGDLAQVPSPYLIGGLGALGRSVGIWVLQVDAERARAVIAELRESDAVDEGALAAEALAGVAPGGEEPAPARPTLVQGAGSTRFSPAAQALAIVLLLAIAMGLITTGCRGAGRIASGPALARV